MKTLPYLNPYNKNIVSIDTFQGLNKAFRIAENELSDSYNMSSADYPVLSVRRKRKHLELYNEDGSKLSTVGGFSSVAVSDSAIAVLTRSGTLYYGNQQIELGVQDNKLLRTGNMLYVYPSGLLIRLPDSADGAITVEDTVKSYSFGKEESSEDGAEAEKIPCVFFHPARLSANDGRISFGEKPNEPELGDYYASSTEGLQMYGDTGSGEYGWVGVEPDGILVQAIFFDKDSYSYLDFSNLFKVGDVVFISDVVYESEKSLKTIESSFEIDSFGIDADGTPSMFLKGYIKKVIRVIECTMATKMPYGLDHVIEHNNRLWGCFSGEDADGNYLNEIYATAQNDPTNWFRFDSTVAQSYAMSVTSDGPFTGAAIVNGYPTFFKESCMHRIYGSSPADYQLQTFRCAGVQKGSEKSICEYNGTVFYKSDIGIMSITSGYPKKISDNLGDEQYSEAIAGVNEHFYYISMKNSEGEREMYVFDLRTGAWHREDSPENLGMFFNYRNILFSVGEKIQDESAERIKQAYEDYINATGVIKVMYLVAYNMAVATAIRDIDITSFQRSEPVKIPFEYISGAESISVSSEDDVRWCFETGDIGYTVCYSKYINKLCVRIRAEAYAQADIEILYDSDGAWENAGSIVGNDTVGNHNIEIIPRRCDHFRLRFSGLGDVKILNITEFLEEGSELH